MKYAPITHFKFVERRLKGNKVLWIDDFRIEWMVFRFLRNQQHFREYKANFHNKRIIFEDVHQSSVKFSAFLHIYIYICIPIFLSFVPTSFPEHYLRLHRYHHYQFVVYFDLKPQNKYTLILSFKSKSVNNVIIRYPQSTNSLYFSKLHGSCPVNCSILYQAKCLFWSNTYSTVFQIRPCIL